MISRWRITAFCAAGALISAASAVQAQYGGAAPPRPAATPTQSSAQSSATAAARKTVLDAQLKVNAVKAKIAQTRLTIEATFQTKDDWVAAKKALADAKAQYAAALKPVMATLQESAEYQKLAESRKAAQAKIETLKAAPRGAGSADQKEQDDEMSAAAGEMLSAGFAMNKMEADARDSDPAVAMAKEAVDEAKKAFDALEMQVTTAMQSDPTYIQEEAELTAAQTELATAKTSLASAEKSARPAPAPKAPASAAGN
jgi:hypothetical protein